MRKNLIYLASGLFLIAVAIFACSQENFKQTEIDISENVVMPVFPEYKASYSYHSEDPSGSRHQNCCECSTSGCSAKKCCSGLNGGNCSCTCSNNWLSGSSCSCGACSNQSTESYELWLTPEQYDVWDEFADILDNDGTATAAQAMDDLLDALDAVDNDDFSAFDAARISMGGHCANLSSTTRGIINTFLDTYDFEDTPL